MLRSYEHSWKNWLIPRLEQGEYKNCIKHLVVLENKEVSKVKDANMWKGHQSLKEHPLAKDGEILSRN